MSDTSIAKDRSASDWLSPIIIKELRQGLRGRVFIFSFFLLQLAMIYCCSGALMARVSQQSSNYQLYSGMFWFIVALPLVAVIPLSGMGMLRNEIKVNSLDLVYLTHLTPWKIVVGKWAALVTQSLLFIFAVLPYLVLRYFLGGVNLISELEMLLIFFVIGVIITSITVGLSAHPVWLVRGAICFGVFIGLWVLLVLIIDAAFSGPSGTGSRSPDNHFLLLLTCYGTLVSLLMLEIGTAKISPPAATRSFSIRIVGLVVLGATLILHYSGTGTYIPVMLAAPILYIICIIAITEQPQAIPSIYAPFARKNHFIRLFSRTFFYPGWPSGTLYACLIFVCSLAFLNKADFDEGFAFTCMIASSLFFAAALTRLIKPATNHGFLWFITIQGILFTIAVFASIVHGFSDISLIAAFLPTVSLLMIAWDSISKVDWMYFAIGNGVLMLLSMVTLLIRGSSWFKRYHELEKASLLDPRD
jgi:hypothetical protein